MPLLATDAAPGHLRMVELCYRFAYLVERQRAGRLQGDDCGELLALGRLLEGDAECSPGRRGHRRFPVQLRATVKGPAGHCDAVVLNISADGLYVAVPRSFEVGSTVQVRVVAEGREYVFTGNVARREVGQLFNGLGLALCCVPLEMRRAA